MAQINNGEKPGFDVPTSTEFTQALGQITWLATQSKEHRDLPIAALEAKVLAPLILKQVRIYQKGKQPIAAVVWASVSEKIKAKLVDEDFVFQLADWRSGYEIHVVDCISPFLDPKTFHEIFLAEVNSATHPTEGAK